MRDEVLEASRGMALLADVWEALRVWHSWQTFGKALEGEKRLADIWDMARSVERCGRLEKGTAIVDVVVASSGEL